MTPLRAKYIRDLVIRGRSKHTQEAYIRYGPPGCYPCRIHRTHGSFGKSSILLFKPVPTVKSFLAAVCASSLTVLYPYIEQRQGQASSNHRVGLRSRLDLKSRSRKRRPTRLQVMSGNKLGEANFVFWCNFANYFLSQKQKGPSATRWIRCPKWSV
jgi:hypothetical protein